MMKVDIYNGNVLINPDFVDPDSFIIMKELDNMDLKVNHLKLYIKTNILAMNNTLLVNDVDKAIDRIQLDIFVNGICEGNNSIRTLLAKNIVFELVKVGIEIPFSSIYAILGINIKSNNNNY